MSKYQMTPGRIASLRRTLRGVERALARGMGDNGKSCCGISVALCHALLELDGAGMAMGKLAEILDLDPSTASRVVEDLVQRGLAERLLSAEDRRTIRVRRSAAGEDKAAEIDRVWNAYFQQVLSAMPEAARAAFSESLPLFLTALRGERVQPEMGDAR